MPKNTDSSNSKSASQLLDLLKQVLPKAAPNPEVAGRIYRAVELELEAKARGAAFEKFCDRVALPNLEPSTLDSIKLQLAEAFAGADVTIKPNRKGQRLAVEVSLPDGAQFQGEIPVRANAAAEDDGEPEVALKFLPFPVSLPGDPELVWALAKREDLSHEEAGIALSKAEEDFWASKTGQKLQRDGVERSFPEFIARSPAGLLAEGGLKRHYKTPEPVKVLRAGTPPPKRSRRTQD